MKNLFTLFLLSFIIQNTWGQQGPNALQEPGMFIGLANGQRVYARKSKMKSPLLKKNFFGENDWAQYVVAGVHYFQNKEGFYPRLNSSKRADFAKRSSVGRISKFYTSRTSYNNY